jgi:NAD(P)-dependent dehydrogenase (short-subunit alcohol dehydrogenase family)
MDLQLVGKTALVTGASMGIGRAIAKGLASEGVQVAAAARRTHLLDELASEIERRQGPRPLLITQDIMAADAASSCAMPRSQASGMSTSWSIAPGVAARCRLTRRRSGGKKRSRSTSPGNARLPMLYFRK